MGFDVFEFVVVDHVREDTMSTLSMLTVGRNNLGSSLAGKQRCESWGIGVWGIWGSWREHDRWDPALVSVVVEDQSSVRAVSAGGPVVLLPNNAARTWPSARS